MLSERNNLNDLSKQFIQGESFIREMDKVSRVARIFRMAITREKKSRMRSRIVGEMKVDVPSKSPS